MITYLFACRCEKLPICAKLESSEARRVGWYDTHAVCSQLYDLNVAGGSPGEDQILIRHAAQTQHIICSFILGQRFWRLLKGVEPHTVLLDYDNTSLGDLNPTNGSQGGDLKGDFAFTVVPNNDFVLGEFGRPAAAN